MKKLLCIILCLIIALSFSACNSKDKNTDSTENNSSVTVDAETEKFNNLVDDVVTSIENDDDLSELKNDVAETKTEIQEKVSNADENDKAQYDVEQIAVFMLEQAIAEYEEAKENNDTEKMNQALNNIEMAKKIWSSEINDN